MRVKVEADDCISCGICVNEAPAIFDWNDEEKAVAISEEVPSKLEAEAQDAIDACPTEAIQEL